MAEKKDKKKSGRKITYDDPLHKYWRKKSAESYARKKAEKK